MTHTNPECIICCYGVESPSSLDCTHNGIFHEDCLNRWGRGRCPICRATQQLAAHPDTREGGTADVPRRAVLLGMPESIITAPYASYSERMQAFLAWMLEHCDDDTRFQTTMLAESVTNLTEEDYCFIRVYNPEPNKGFMFSGHPVIKRITNKVCAGYSGHSGSSMGWTMRFIQYVVCI